MIYEVRAVNKHFYPTKVRKEKPSSDINVKLLQTIEHANNGAGWRVKRHMSQALVARKGK